MRATILDTKTGLMKTVDGPRSWEWAENGWSCDCNRNPWNVDTGKPGGICKGSERFLVVAAEMNDPEDYQYSLAELNQGYPKDLVAVLTALESDIGKDIMTGLSFLSAIRSPSMDSDQHQKIALGSASPLLGMESDGDQISAKGSS